MKKRLIVVNSFTPHSPGRYFLDALKQIGFTISLFDETIDFQLIPQESYDAILFIEDPFRGCVVNVLNIQDAKLPRLFWNLHGESLLPINLQKCRDYRINLNLLAMSLHLAGQYGIPYRELPMAIDPRFLNNQVPLANRTYDLSFIGSYKPVECFGERNKLLDLIQGNFANRKLYISDQFNPENMAKVYADSKIIFTWCYKNYLTQRLFEGMAAGALLLTNYAHRIELLGQNRVHYVIYRHSTDLLHKIDFYLNHIDKTQRVADNGYQKVAAEHTYLHRAHQFGAILQEYLDSI